MQSMPSRIDSRSARSSSASSSSSHSLLAWSLLVASLLLLGWTLVQHRSMSDSGSNMGQSFSTQPRQGVDGGGGSLGVFSADAHQWMVGLRALDTRRGDQIPPDRAGEGREWIDVRKIAEERVAPTRILPKGSFATMDYVPPRLNIHLDEEGKVERVAMG